MATMSDLFLPPDAAVQDDVPPADLDGLADAIATELPAGDPTKPFGCDICGNTYTRKDRLNRHRKEQHQAPPAPAGSPGRPRKNRDAPPTTVRIDLGSRAKAGSSDLAKVEERAGQLVNTLAAVVLLMGQPDDAVDLQRGADAWAGSVRELAEHEEWLRKLFTSAEDAGRMVAWLQFAMATGGLVMPILIRHGALPGNLAELAGNVFATGAAVNGGTDAAAA